MAVAHIMKLSLTAVRRRQKMWREAGGPNREKRVLAEIPKVRIRYRWDD